MITFNRLFQHIRTINIQQDLTDVREIEVDSFEFPWDEDDFVSCLGQEDVSGIVTELLGTVIGYAIFVEDEDMGEINVLNFAVSPAHRRRGVGTAMTQEILSKLSPPQCNLISVRVRTKNILAQRFWRSQKFRRVDVLPKYYGDFAEDAYLMRRTYHT